MHTLKQSSRCLCQWIPPLVTGQIRTFHPIALSVMSLRRSSLSLLPAPSFRTTHVNASTQSMNNSKPVPVAESQTLPVDSVTSISPIKHEGDEPDVLYHKIEIEIRSSEPAVLESYYKFMNMAAGHLGLTLHDREVCEKPHKKRWTVLKSAFGHRKHMVQYEIRTYHQKLSLVRLTGSTADTFLEYIQRNLPEGVAMRVGRIRMEKIPEHLLTPPAPDDLEPSFPEDTEEPSKVVGKKQ